jgi:hypothetical protein
MSFSQMADGERDDGANMMMVDDADTRSSESQDVPVYSSSGIVRNGTIPDEFMEVSVDSPTSRACQVRGLADALVMELRGSPAEGGAAWRCCCSTLLCGHRLAEVYLHSPFDCSLSCSLCCPTLLPAPHARRPHYVSHLPGCCPVPDLSCLHIVSVCLPSADLPPSPPAVPSHDNTCQGRLSAPRHRPCTWQAGR